MYNRVTAMCCRLVDCFVVSSPVTSLAFSPTSMFLATSHVGDVGVYLWSNTLLFSSMVLTSLPEDFEPSVIELPSSSHQTLGDFVGVFKFKTY